MPITNHVTSLELSTKLESLGVPQESIFYHFNGKVLMNHELKGRTMSEDNRTISAYLASELGELLPSNLNHTLPDDVGRGRWLSIDKSDDGNWVAIYSDDGVAEFEQEAETMTDATAQLLIWLLENHLISVEELGK